VYGTLKCIIGACGLGAASVEGVAIKHMHMCTVIKLLDVGRLVTRSHIKADNDLYPPASTSIGDSLIKCTAWRDA